MGFSKKKQEGTFLSLKSLISNLIHTVQGTTRQRTYENEK